MTKVVIYSRFSSDLQDERSIADQERSCEEYAAKQGWQVIGKYSDHAISGASMANRPGILQVLKAANSGLFDIVLSEALDRVSRGQADTALLYEDLRFTGVELHTISEGKIDEMRVGFMGTMNSMFLRELSRKVHRGLKGRALNGKNAGGNCYGYDVVRQRDEADNPICGDRTINENEAAIVRRIFTDYAKGKSPRKIAYELNEDGVPGPTGGSWAASTIGGNRQRGTGILNNELYVGRQVWNRLRYEKNLRTGKRVSKLNPESEWVITDVPELRILDQDAWDKVKEYQGALNRRGSYGEKRRPQHLLSFLLKCGECGGGMSMISRSHYGCSSARNKGTCSNRLSKSREQLEAMVVGALRSRLMDTDLTQAFCKEYTAHLNKLRIEKNAELERSKRELEKVERDMEKLLRAVMDGLAVKYAQDALEKLQVRKDELEAVLQEKEEAPVLIHPAMANRYAEAIQSLMESINDPEHRDESAKVIRTLVDKIVLTPSEDRTELIVDMKGDLAAILSLAGAKEVHAKPRTLDQMCNEEQKEIERVGTVLVATKTIQPRHLERAGAGIDGCGSRI